LPTYFHFLIREEPVVRPHDEIPTYQDLGALARFPESFLQNSLPVQHDVEQSLRGLPLTGQPSSATLASRIHATVQEKRLESKNHFFCIPSLHRPQLGLGVYYRLP